MEVHKFGGASIKDAQSIQNLAEIVKDLPAQSILIISAMGKTTNALEEVVVSYVQETGDAPTLLDQIKSRHYKVVDELGLTSDDVKARLNDVFVEAEWILEDPIGDPYDYIYDQIVAVGELVATRIVSAYLSSQGLTNQWIDARDVIRTDDSYRCAHIQWDKTNERCQSLAKTMAITGERFVTQGFIGGTADNNTTTLGREGSDYTGAVIAAAVQADSLTLWKDVGGIMDGDPSLYADAQLIDCLSYHDASLLTKYGAKVIHAKTIKPLWSNDIPLRVRSFQMPSAEGSLVTADCIQKVPQLRVLMDGLTLITWKDVDTLPDFNQTNWSDLCGQIHCIAEHPARLVVSDPDFEALTDLALKEGWQYASTPVQMETILNPANVGEFAEDASYLLVRHEPNAVHLVTAMKNS